MFPAITTAAIRFIVRPKGAEKRDPCPLCGKRRGGEWTMTVPFAAVGFGPGVSMPKSELLAPFTGVCRSHPLAPDAAALKELDISIQVFLAASAAAKTLGGAQ